MLSEAEDAFGRRFAVLTYPWVGHLTVVLETEPDGAALTDQWQIDQWVARYGGWLATLPQEAGQVAAAVSIEAAPDPGTRLRHMIDQRMKPDAPAFAREVVGEMRDTFTSGSNELRARVALTYRMRDLGGRKLTATEFAHQLATRLGPLSRTWRRRARGSRCRSMRSGCVRSSGSRMTRGLRSCSSRRASEAGRLTCRRESRPVRSGRGLQDGLLPP